MSDNTKPPYAYPTLLEYIGTAIFAIRWGLVPMYAGLWVAIMAYAFKMGLEIVDLASKVFPMTLEDLMLRVIGLIDMIMVGNLVVMMAVGGYSIFVREFDLSSITNRPRWMNGLNSSALKIKMGMSLIGVSSVHLLKTFMEASKVSASQIVTEVGIHLVFILTTLGYCVISTYLQHPPEKAHT